MLVHGHVPITRDMKTSLSPWNDLWNSLEPEGYSSSDAVDTNDSRFGGPWSSGGCRCQSVDEQEPYRRRRWCRGDSIVDTLDPTTASTQKDIASLNDSVLELEVDIKMHYTFIWRWSGTTCKWHTASQLRLTIIGFDTSFLGMSRTINIWIDSISIASSPFSWYLSFCVVWLRYFTFLPFCCCHRTVWETI